VTIRFRKDEVHHTSNSKLNSLQSGTVAKENAGRLEAGRHDLVIVKAIKQSGELERRIQTLVGEKECVNIERERLCREQMEAQKQIRDLQGENQKLEDEVKVLEERIANFKGAQNFLTTVDQYAGADIMKMVEDLNDEIFQGAFQVSELHKNGDAFEVDKPGKNAQLELTKGDRDNLTQFIGPNFLEHLSTNSEQLQVDPFPLQLAVQAMLTKWCVFMVDSFYPGPASNDLKKIYRRIWESGRRSCTNARTMYVIIDI
jgi:hypothetical protein